MSRTVSRVLAAAVPGRVHVLEREQTIARPLVETFAFFADPGNLQAITPEWLRFRILEAPERLTGGSQLRYRLRLLGWRISWLTEITDWEPPHRFADVQRRGPYRLWEHTHEFEDDGLGGTRMRDTVRYSVPGGPFAPIVQRVVALWLRRIFDFRRDRMARLLA